MSLRRSMKSSFMQSAAKLKTKAGEDEEEDPDCKEDDNGIEWKPISIVEFGTETTTTTSTIESDLHFVNVTFRIILFLMVNLD